MPQRDPYPRGFRLDNAGRIIEPEAAPCPNNVVCRTCSCCAAFRAERDRYREALERIAAQGLGEWHHAARCMMGATGERWEHWADIAREALDIDKRFQGK